MNIHVFYSRKINGIFNKIFDLGMLLRSYCASVTYNRCLFTFLKLKCSEFQNTPDPKLPHKALWICPFLLGQTFQDSSPNVLFSLYCLQLTIQLNFSLLYWNYAKVISKLTNSSDVFHFFSPLIYEHCLTQLVITWFLKYSSFSKFPWLFLVLLLSLEILSRPLNRLPLYPPCEDWFSL